MGAKQISPLGAIPIEEIAKENTGLIAELKEFEPVSTAATFGGLLVLPELQANCFRLEALVHLAVAYCAGSMSPTKGLLRRSFRRLGDGYCGAVEDPAEDVFVTLVSTRRGNFRVLEGIREATGFHLQRVLNVVESMPTGSPYDEIRSAVECLLRLSDAVAGRAGMPEYSLGQEMPLDSLTPGLADWLSSARGMVRFSEGDLARLQIPMTLLAEFAFNPDDRLGLPAQSIGHTGLERRPVAFRGQSAHLLLPTAVGSAITRFVVEAVISMGQLEAFDRALAREFAQLFNETPILGGRSGAPIGFQRISGGRIGAVMTEVDPGRFLHLIFFVDGVNGFLEGGLSGVNATPDALASTVSMHIKLAAAQARAQRDFRDGLSLVVGCGFGRALYFELEGDLPPDWRLEAIGAHDLATLSWLSAFDRLSLWRLLDSQEAIERQGVKLINVNGLLNLVAWSRQLHGHLVPHGQLPEGFAAPGADSLVMVSQNAVRDLRHSVMVQWDPRRVLDSEGRWVAVRKLGRSHFEEDNTAPLYASEEDVRNGRLRGVYVATRRPWWIEIRAPEDAPKDSVCEHWEMLCAWLKRVAPVLDETYESLPATPVSFLVSFAEVVGATTGTVKPKNADELRSLVQVSAQAGNRHIEIKVARGFDDGMMQPENVAERVLVEALVAGAAEAGGEVADINKRAGLVERICPNSEARHIHRFEARSYRDFLGDKLSTRPLLIDPLDDAACRIGLGWRVRQRGSSPEISGVPECTSYLNDVVRALLDEICGGLRCLDRRSFVSTVLHNHEAAAYDREVWQRTARANLALHDDKTAAVGTIVEHHSRLNACFLASRILLEAAVCECPLQGGRTPGQLDLSRLMAQVMLAHYLGGWSDAIRWGAMEARLRITALGDVHMNHAFFDTVYQPFGRIGREADVRRTSDAYADLYAPAQVGSTMVDLLEPLFLRAWDAEFDASLDGIRAFVDHLEDLGLQRSAAIVDLPRSALVAMLAAAAGTSLEKASVTLDLFTLAPRPEWRAVTGGFEDRDWHPWRFRRRLSVLRRPLLQVDQGEDPNFLVAPGLVREAMAITVVGFHSGEIPPWQPRSAEMRSWIGHANHHQRRAFNSSVANRMQELGWQVEPEVKLTKLLGQSLDLDYGDIDVLAWRPDSGRVLIIECKDVQYRKTLGEVAEQLGNFRGEIRADGRPDELRRHLNRVEVLTAKELAVARALKLALPIQIEGHLVFKNPVPMQFAWNHMASRIQLSLFSELDRL